nr:hypothetical protein [Staphylococcus pseudintermedius]
MSQVTNGSTTRDCTFVSTVDSLKDKASNNGTPSEFESVVSVHGSMSTSASASTSASTSTSDAVSTEASEFVSAVDSR